MASRDFEAGSSNRMASTATSYNTRLTVGGVTMAALVTVEALPGAGTYRTMLSVTSATGARNLYLGLAGGGGDALSAVYGATQVDFGAASGLVPTVDAGAWPGTWYIMAATKVTGTAAPIGYMFNLQTRVMVTATAGGTSGNRTAGLANGNLGAGIGAADFWDGRIAYAGIFDRVLTVNQIMSLCCKNQWRALNEDSPFGMDADLTWRTNPMGMDQRHPNLYFNTGTIPGITGHSPPGFC